MEKIVLVSSMEPSRMTLHEVGLFPGDEIPVLVIVVAATTVEKIKLV